MSRIATFTNMVILPLAPANILRRYAARVLGPRATDPLRSGARASLIDYAAIEVPLAAHMIGGLSEEQRVRLQGNLGPQRGSARPVRLDAAARWRMMLQPWPDPAQARLMGHALLLEAILHIARGAIARRCTSGRM